jgi:hypothetical protein
MVISDRVQAAEYLRAFRPGLDVDSVFARRAVFGIREAYSHHPVEVQPDNG